MHTQVTLFHLLLLLIPFHFQFPLASQGCHQEERKALLNFKSSLEDPANLLSSWQEGSQNCCDWHGIGCSNDSFHVIKIDLQNMDTTALRGKISPSLFKITHLEYLDLSGNDFYQQHEIPFQFANLTKLAHLDLSNSKIMGSLTTQFANLSSLQYLDLSSSYNAAEPEPLMVLLSMEWVRQLVNLKVLRLSGLDLYEATSSGYNFGEHMSYLSNLRDLDLSSCNIDNPVSLIQTFHNLSRLYSLNMNGNHNSIAKSKFQLHLDNLTSLSILELCWCELEGPVAYLPQLTELDVSRNGGDLHLDFTKMFEHQWPKLKKLWIDHNSVRVEGSFANAPQLSRLSASYCSIQGSLPSLISNLSQLQFLDLSENNISGQIHSSISNLKNLYSLDLSGNNFQGSIPESISNLKNLYSIDLSRNNFQGSIPESICEIIPLQELWLSYNNISGSIPSCITNLRHVSTFDVSKNSIEGNVPLISWINKLNLTQIDLTGNMLTVIMDQDLPLSQFKLQSLRLGSCNISGSIPTFICNLTHLEHLDLSDNHLTGDIPSCLYKLKYFSSFNIWNAGLLSPAEPPLLPGPPHQYNYAKENVLFYGDVALGFIVGFWGLFFGLLLKKEKWWCGYWRFVDAVATRIVRGCRQLIHVCTEMVVG